MAKQTLGFGTIVHLYSAAWKGPARGSVEHVGKDGLIKVNLACSRAPEILAIIKGTPMAGKVCDFEDLTPVEKLEGEPADGDVVAVVV